MENVPFLAVYQESSKIFFLRGVSTAGSAKRLFLRPTFSQRTKVA